MLHRYLNQIMNPPSDVSPISSLSEEELTSSRRKRKRLRSSFNPYPEDAMKSKLPQDVSKWHRLNVQHNLQIYYDTKYTKNPQDLIHMMAESVSQLSQEQTEYIDNVNRYLTFTLPFSFFLNQDDLVETELKECKTAFDQLRNEEGMLFDNLKNFVSGLQALLREIRLYRRRIPFPFENVEGLFTKFAGLFADLCCLRVEYCCRYNHVVMGNLKGVKVSTAPDLRLFTEGLNRDFSMTNVVPETVIPVTEVKRYDEDHLPSSAEDFKIELDLHDRVLGQHAGALLLELHHEHKKEDRKNTEDELKKKLTMPGMIIKGTEVFFTLLEMTQKHYQKLRYNEDLDEDDRAVIYYSRPKDFLLQQTRRSLIADFMLLNNINTPDLNV